MRLGAPGVATGLRQARGHALELATELTRPWNRGLTAENAGFDPLLNEQLASMDERVQAVTRRQAGLSRVGTAPELRSQMSEMQDQVDSLLRPWDCSNVAPPLPRDARWTPRAKTSHAGISTPRTAGTPPRSPRSAPRSPRDNFLPRGSIMDGPSHAGLWKEPFSAQGPLDPPTGGFWPPAPPPPPISKERIKPPSRILAFPNGGRIGWDGGAERDAEPNSLLQRTLEGMEATEITKNVLLERILEGVESREISTDEGVGALESGLLEARLPRGAASVRMGLDRMIDSMLERPDAPPPKRELPPAPTSSQRAEIVHKNTIGARCPNCPVLHQQISALAQALTGFCSLAYHWSAGLPAQRRRVLAELALEYAGPCSHIDADLAGLCAELEKAKWGEDPPRPRRRPSQPEDPHVPEVETPHLGAAEATQPRAEVRPRRSVDWWQDEPPSPDSYNIQSYAPRKVQEAGKSAGRSPRERATPSLEHTLGIGTGQEADALIEGPPVSGNPQPFWVDNSGLRAKGAGISYCRTRNLDDKYSRAVARWDMEVQGTLVDQDWLQVGTDKYLPVRIDGVRVLVKGHRPST
mmetsp:Transcript_46054/g.81005  ORF Transcript_46054/g.81005 Transcript_46054/m.81005 type:complete len:581 (+) Transcript_46054:66-1808(+)